VAGAAGAREPDGEPMSGTEQSTPYAGVAETHSGAVVFLGERAYKFKKPLAFPFVDYSTLDARRLACEEEVALNRRLAPDVYLGVGELHAPGQDDPEPVVVMRRLPVDRRLSTLVRGGFDVSGELRALARVVARFHGAAPSTPAAVIAAGPDATLGRWEANAAEMAEAASHLPDPGASGAVLADARTYLAGRRDLLERRVADGWAREGHGDLLTDDIFCLADGPRVLDCLEFDERLRTGDVLADVAFLAMDLERLGRADLGWSFIEDHAALLGDRWPASLAHHHIAYRAQVRAKVACLRAAQGGEGATAEAAQLLGIAARHLEAGRVRLVLVGGPPGTGKSTLATSLGGALGAVVLRSDEVRKELAGLPPLDRAAADLDEGIYGAASTAATYDALLARARSLLAGGESVVLDASWQDPGRRAAARVVASDAHASPVELRCSAPAELVAERVTRRLATGTDASDADAAVARAIAERFPAWPEAVEVPTTGPVTESAAVALAAVRGQPAT
jgi:aminoglycoside phosphotransferase family enzyme/predicted kinase